MWIKLSDEHADRRSFSFETIERQRRNTIARRLWLEVRVILQHSYTDTFTRRHSPQRQTQSRMWTSIISILCVVYYDAVVCVNEYGTPKQPGANEKATTKQNKIYRPRTYTPATRADYDLIFDFHSSICVDQYCGVFDCVRTRIFRSLTVFRSRCVCCVLWSEFSFSLLVWYCFRCVFF